MTNKAMVPQRCPTCDGSGEVVEVSGEFLRKARKAAGIGLNEFARRCDLSAPYLSDVERGNRRATPDVVAHYVAQIADGPARAELRAAQGKVAK